MTPPVLPPLEEQLVERRQILDEAGILRSLKRIAHEIVEESPGAEELALVGIRTGGLFLAERLQKLIAQIDRSEGEPAKSAAVSAPALGAMDITLYRDDVFQGLPKPEVGPTDLPFSLPGRTIVLIDDVLFTGRTVRAALDALMDYGRPRAVRLAVLVDRGLRELPIQADFVGVRVETTSDQSVEVQLRERGLADRVVLRERVSAGPGGTP